jgi:transcriptional regulator with XRE-family HTH domain
MEKTKLAAMRESKKLLQKQVADHLGLDVSSYCKREKGLVYITIEEWEKISNFLNVPISKIYEPDEGHTFVCNDNDSCNFLGTNNGTNINCTVPQSLLETQAKYIQILEEKLKEFENQKEQNWTSNCDKRK